MFWRLKTHHEYPNDALNWYRNYHLIALGWGHIGDLQVLQPHNQDDIWDLYWQTYGNDGNNSNGYNCKRCLWRFWREMSIGDEVILVTKRRVCVVRVTGGYFFDENYPDDVDAQALEGYCHRRTAEYAGNDDYADKVWKPGPQPGTNIFNALIRLNDPEN